MVPRMKPLLPFKLANLRVALRKIFLLAEAKTRQKVPLLENNVSSKALHSGNGGHERGPESPIHPSGNPCFDLC